MTDVKADGKGEKDARSDGSCPEREDGTHCVHWWDDEGPCCGCGFDGELDNG